MSLRERKNAQTRALIQAEALRLFAEQGYEETTVEQVAAAVGISARTVFRYFPRKENLVTHDRYDRILAEEYQAQPAQCGALPAFRSALAALIQSANEELAQTRRQLLLDEGLRLGGVRSLLNTQELLVTLAQERMAGAPREQVEAVAGAVMGALVIASTQWMSKPDVDAASLLDRILAVLEGVHLDGADHH